MSVEGAERSRTYLRYLEKTSMRATQPFSSPKNLRFSREVTLVLELKQLLGHALLGTPLTLVMSLSWST